MNNKVELENSAASEHLKNLIENSDQTPTVEMIELLKIMEKLSYLCHNYEPGAIQQPTEVLSLLKEFEINEDPDNPFAVSNQILILTDKTENLIKSKIQ